MNNIKKIGLSALAGSMVAMSAQAGDMSVTGVATMSMTKGSETGKTTYSMNNHVNFSGTTELDNGLTITYAMELDADEGDAGNGVDNPSITIATDGMGTLVFAGEGGSSSMSAMDDKTPNAYEEAFDGLGTSAVVINGHSANNMFTYTSENFGGAVATVAFVPAEDTAAGANNSTYMDFGVTYTPDMVEGLTLGYAMGTTEATVDSEVDESTMYATYAVGGLTVGYQVSDYDATTAANSDESVAIGISYAVTEDFSVSYNEHTVDIGDSSSDQEAEGISASYTMGGITIAGHSNEMKNVKGTAGTNDEGYEINVSFAF
ncbi:porin [Candidatus Pelagibacter sp. HIMB1746]|uniref:porin n=1 Tax=Candidatus Pelagibacter sp. HIMB1746 TaxID=3413370 RepID=UPI003F833134